MALDPEVRKFLCVSCPVGCQLSVEISDGTALSVSGNACPLGVKYANSEVTNPLRTFTSTVRVRGGSLPVCPVRSRTPIPLNMVFDVAREVALYEATAPIEIGQILIEDVCGVGVDIISSRTLV